MSDIPDWLHEPALQQFFAATHEAGGHARAVGGAVRDFLLGIEGADVDVASTLTPEQTIEIAAQQGWKAIPTGIAHGTVTLVLPTRILEVTTLRRDVTTDGRRATVAYTDNWQEDAARRDFTINALSMDADGTIHDYYGGKEDLSAQRVRFIGDAAMRIAEDGLRILRYFRFLASHGKPPADAEALAAIAAHKNMIAQLSGERIANEMKKLLSVPNPAFALRLMVETGIAALVFGRSIEPSRIIRLHMLEHQADYQTSVWARVVLLMLPPPVANAPTSPLEGEVTSGAAATNLPLQGLEARKVDGYSSIFLAQGRPEGAGGGSAQSIANRWKLSRNEAAQLRLMAELPAFVKDAPRHVHTRIIRLHGAPAYLDWLLTQAAAGQGANVADYVQLAHDFVPPVFPITAKDVNLPEGKALGDRLRLLETKWEASDYTLTKAQLLED